MTLGHAIIGRDPDCLEFCREHEQAHVRQVERWGAAFIPAYLIASLLAWRRGEHYYHDNWFERDARRACGQRDGIDAADPDPARDRPPARRLDAPDPPR